MRKLMFGAGLACSFVGAAFAGERSRGTSGAVVVTGDTGTVTAPVIHEIAPGVAKISSGGFERTVRADGSIQLSESIQEYGTLDRYNFEMGVLNSAMATTRDGSRMYANGAVGFFKDLLGSNPPALPEVVTAEEFKSVMAWTEMMVESKSVVVFANGAVFNDGSLSAEPEWSRHAQSVPSSSDGSSAVYADGTVFKH
jgi:hypothetical protein